VSIGPVAKEVELHFAERRDHAQLEPPLARSGGSGVVCQY
jgi:hypothetical protein